MAPTDRRSVIRVTGVVQGVGFRPFVASLAESLGLSGFVGNDPDGVFIEVEGPDDARGRFIAGLSAKSPPLADVQSVSVVESPGTGIRGFSIVASGQLGTRTSIPPDTAVCSQCLDEMRDPGDRRFGHPFIACMNCGPRFTITTGLPYDRDHTTMADFPMCAACLAEYEDPRSRRFHAQPTSCPDCGPTLSMPPDEVAARLGRGEIIAMKGIGGYHLACDAANPSAVQRLRTRKQRGDKPFALLAADLDRVRDIVTLDDAAEQVLTSAARPIVLLPSRAPGIQAAVAPGNASLGVMLPYAPVHYLVFDAGAPRLLVMTSGNLADEPICTSAEEAELRLAGIADAFCHHDRRIHVACDDSVVRSDRGAALPVRRSRGYAPLPIRLAAAAAPLLAVGGELKTAACLAADGTAWMSQHIGDTENLQTLAMLERTIESMERLLRIEPEVIASDMHPGYLSRRWAQERAAALGIAHFEVQHHHAHLASLLSEQGWTEGPVLGFAFDGTGFGLDGTIWGGELLLGGIDAVERIGHLRAIALPGGDAAVRHPARTALAHLDAAAIPADGTASRSGIDDIEAANLRRLHATGSHCTPTTSMGRLFDAIASLLAVRHRVDYEGQAAIELEALARAAPTAAPGDWIPEVAWAPDGLVLDPAPAIRAAVASHRDGLPAPAAALAFHLGLAEAVRASAEAVRARTGVDVVGLTGGVFANTVLTDACRGRLQAAGFTVLSHRLVPPNDGGLALGQAAVAASGVGGRTS